MNYLILAFYFNLILKMHNNFEGFGISEAWTENWVSIETFWKFPNFPNLKHQYMDTSIAHLRIQFNEENFGAIILLRWFLHFFVCFYLCGVDILFTAIGNEWSWSHLSNLAEPTAAPVCRKILPRKSDWLSQLHTNVIIEDGWDN